MIKHPAVFAATALMAATYASSTLAADAGMRPTPMAIASSTKPDDIPGRATMLAFVNATASGNSARAYGMLSDAKRTKMSAASFGDVIAPLVRSGIIEFQTNTTRTSKKLFGYDNEFGFYKELHTTTFAGTLVTRHTGSTEMSITVIAFAGSWYVHAFSFKPLNPMAAQADEEILHFDRRIVALIRAGKKTEASLLAQDAVASIESRLGSPHPVVAQRLDNLAFTLRMDRRYSDAEPHLKRALAMREKIFGKDNPYICQSLSNLSVLYEMQQRLADVETLLKRSLAIREQAFGPHHPAVGQTFHELANLYKRQGRAREAEVSYGRAVAILGEAHPAVLMTLIERGEYEKAAALLDITNAPHGDRDAAEAAVRRTFFGQVDNLRWTGLRVQNGPDPQLIVLQGEATHRNAIWNSFEVDMAHDGSGWRMRSIRALPIAWK